MGINLAPPPKGHVFQLLMKSILYSKASLKRIEERDRGEGTLRDGYTTSQIPQHTTACWEHGKPDIGLRSSLDFLLGHHCLMRLGNRLGAELPDCFMLDVPTEGSKPDGQVSHDRDYTTKAFVILMDQGKTNTHGRMEYGGAFRNKDVKMCVVSALAFFLFYRWQVEGKEKTPNFGSSSHWYSTKIIRRSADQSSQSLSDNTAREQTKRMYIKCGIKATAVTHLPRQTAVKHAANLLVSDPDVRYPGPLPVPWECYY